MDNMFKEASSFNQPLDQWDVSNVYDMYSMFREASSFNQPLDNWNVSFLYDMDHMMFYNTKLDYLKIILHGNKQLKIDINKHKKILKKYIQESYLVDIIIEYIPAVEITLHTGYKEKIYFSTEEEFISYMTRS